MKRVNGGDLLTFVVVNRGKANAVLKEAKECKATSVTIVLGEAMSQNTLLERLGLTERHKEILMIQAGQDGCERLRRLFDGSHHAFKKGKGAVFSVPFRRIHRQEEQEQKQEAPPVSHYCVIIVVDRGRGAAAMKAARAGGATEGFLIHGRGAGVPKDFYVPLVIEPQKDVVMAFATKDEVAGMQKKIFTDLELERIGNGVVFTLPISDPVGLFECSTEDDR